MAMAVWRELSGLHRMRHLRALVITVRHRRWAWIAAVPALTLYTTVMFGPTLRGGERGCFAGQWVLDRCQRTLARFA
jgi:hypothetical protein